MASDVSFTWQGIDFWIHNVGSPMFAASTDNVRVTVSYFVRYEDTFEAIQALLGYTEVVKVLGSAGYYSRALPHTPEWHEDLEGKVYAKEIREVKPLNPLLRETNQPNFLSTLLTVVYERLPYELLEDFEITQLENSYGDVGGGGVILPILPWEGDAKRFIHVREKDIHTAIDTKGAEYYWDMPEKKPVGQGFPVPVPRVEVTYTWYAIPIKTVNYTMMDLCRFTTNKTNLGPYRAETLLFMSREIEETIMGNLEKACNVKLVFHYYPNGVNKFPNPYLGRQFTKVLRKSNGQGIFPVELYDQMFFPAPGTF